MAKKYTTMDLKREVDRLNKEFKKTDRTAIKFVFGKGRGDNYYIGTMTNSKANKAMNKKERKSWDQALSASKDINYVINDVRSKDFKKRNKKHIERAHQTAMREINYERTGDAFEFARKSALANKKHLEEIWAESEKKKKSKK